MTIKDLYNEVIKLKDDKILTDQPKLERAFHIVNKYAEQNNISFDAAIGRIVGYMEAQKCDYCAKDGVDFIHQECGYRLSLCKGCYETESMKKKKGE